MSDEPRYPGASVSNAPNHRHGKIIHAHPEPVGSAHSHSADMATEAEWDVEPLYGLVYSPLVFDEEK
jgi:hypothetical protein